MTGHGIEQKKGLSPAAVLALGTAIPFLILLLAYWRVGLFPFGERDILEIDSVHQYLPFLTELRRRLVNGESLYYSFSGGLGYNFWSTIAYYAASPINLFMVLIPEASVCDFMAWMMLLKLSLSGGILSWYLFRRNREGALYALALGTMYALSNFFLGYKFNVMWLDSIAVTPVILFGLERLVREKRPGIYIIALFYALWCNYYIGYMICLFLCLYLLCLLWGERACGEEKLLPCLLRFAASSLSAGGMAAVLLLPAYLSLKLTPSALYGQGPGISFYTNPFSLLRSHLVGTAAFRTSYQRGDAQIYCGVAVLLLCVLYFANRGIERRRRIGMGALLGLLMFSFTFSPLNYLWHGLHLETGLPNRFAFLYLILLLTVCYDGLCRMKELKTRTLLLAAGGAVLLVVLAAAGTDGATAGALSAGLLALYALLLFASRFHRAFHVLLCLLMVLESAGQCLRDFTEDGGDEKAFYVSYQQDAQTMLNRSGEEGFYRVDFDSDSMINFATYTGVKGVALFHSGMQAGVQNLFQGMHVYTKLNTVWYKGVSKPLMDILGQRYLLTAYANAERWNGLEKVDSENGRSLYRNPDALSVGYLVNREILDWNPAGQQGMEAENSFFRLACGEPDLFQQQLYFFGVSGVSYSLDLPEDGMVFLLPDGDTDTLTWQTPQAGRVFERRTHMLYQGEGSGSGDHVSFSATTKDGENYTGHSYTCDGAAYRSALEKLKQCQLEQVQVTGSRLSGTLHATREGILLLTVPFHPGWTIWVDGEECTAQEVGGALIGIDVSEGDHTLEMEFTPPGIRLGGVLSALSLLLAAAVCVGAKKQRAIEP